jgi:hypothetical protein
MVFYFQLRNLGFVLIQVIGLGLWMLLAPICILYCKQCNTIYEYNICWFSRFGFPGEKSLCNVCICHCIFCVLFLISVCSRYCTRLGFTMTGVIDLHVEERICCLGGTLADTRQTSHTFTHLENGLGRIIDHPPSP